MTSVRRKLLVALLVAVVVISVASVAATYLVARHQLDQVFDYELQQMAHLLSDRALAQQVARSAPPDADLSVQITEGGIRMNVAPQGDAPAMPEVAELGFSDMPRADGEWRVFAIRVGPAVVQMGQPLKVREEMAFRAALWTLVPLGVLLPLLALLVWSIVHRGMAPLSRLAGAVTARTPSALEPVEERGVPVEALPLVRSLNDLLARLQAAMAAQRAFVADAAHELRTPLAALKLQVQLAERAPDASARAQAMAELAGGLERGTHLVQQLLTLARQDPGAGPPAVRAPVALATLVRQAVADHAVLAEVKGVDLGAARADEAAVIEGEQQALRTLLANLVDNAIRYTPGGGRVDVSAGVVDGAGPYLEVADTGPGVPAAERARVFDRFYRVPGAGEGGSGLGLSIVKAIADRHGARLGLAETPGGGLTVRVEFPAVAAAGRAALEARSAPS